MLAEWLEHKSQLNHYIVKHTGDPVLADDILQDVYIKASQRIHQLEDQGKFKNWLYRITHNTIMDFYRQSEDHDELFDVYEQEEESAEFRNLQSMGQCLRPMFDCLPEKYRNVLVLSELDGLPQQEVANQIGLSLSGTKSRIQRGRVKLKALITDCCNVESGREGIIDFHPKPECIEYMKQQGVA